MSLWMPKKKPLYAPVLSTLGGGSVRAFGFGTSGGGAEGWITSYNLSNTFADYEGLAIDSNDNIIVTGNRGHIHKCADDGSLIWQKKLSTGDVKGAAVDSNDNIIVCGSGSVGGTGTSGFLVKLNSSGVIQWQRRLDDSSSDYFDSVAVDSNDDIVVGGDFREGAYGSLPDFVVAKYNSSGTLQWYREMGGPTNIRDEFVGDIVIDSSNNIYAIGGSASDGAGSYDWWIGKFSSSGSLTWQKTYGYSSTDRGRGLALDSSGDLIAVGQFRPGAWGAGIAKISSSNGAMGTVKIFRHSSVPEFHSVAIDSQGYIYAVGNSDDGTDNMCISKFDSNLNVEWHNEFDSVGAGLLHRVRINSNDEPIVSGVEQYFGNNGSYSPIVAKIPHDGTGHGSYDNYMTYQTTPFTTMTWAGTEATAQLGVTSNQLTSGTPSLTIANDTTSQIAFHSMNQAKE